VNIRKFVACAQPGGDRPVWFAHNACGGVPEGSGSGLNIVVSGGTQAGKTTMLKCLAAAIPGSDRVVSAEEAFELRFSHPDWVAMQTRQAGLEGTGEIRLRELVKQVLRMRPSRLVIGEVRAEECVDLRLALNAGCRGWQGLTEEGAVATSGRRFLLGRLTAEAPMTSGCSSCLSPNARRVHAERAGERSLCHASRSG
jgi:hypothetical protein